jgi:ATP-dependent DNA helicase DinG
MSSSVGLRIHWAEKYLTYLLGLRSAFPQSSHMPSALTDKVKDTIQTAYRTWLESRDFKPRRGQREMIAQIARTLAGDGDRVAVVEAGTGTGKTAAYCLAAIPVAQSLGKTVVLSTATVALQEQVVLQDLPDIKERAGLSFSLSLAKGRGRYVCLKRLDDHLKYQEQQAIPIFDVSDEDHTVLYQEMLSRYGQGAWDGEFDSWPESMADGAWSTVTTDHRGCSNNRCSFFKQCPFFRARGNLEGSDVIVANHDLVLSDLALGGGAVLPDPEDCIYVLDEAHHIADKTQNHFSTSARINSTHQWLDNVNNILSSLTQRFARPHNLLALATSVAGETVALQSMFEALSAGLNLMPFETKDEDREIYRFPLGEVPETLMDLSLATLPSMNKLCDDLERVHDLLQEAVAGNLDWEKAFEAEDWLLPVGQLQSRALATKALLEDYASGAKQQRRYARWLNRNSYDVEMVSAPIEPGHILQEVLWQRCYGAVCTSATITALGRFDRFIERVGLPAEVPTLVIASPFNYPEIATFHVPSMQSDPRDFEAHSAEITELLPELLKREESALVLFTSWRQLNAVVKALPDKLSDGLLVQGDGSKQALIVEHKRRVDGKEGSYLFGLASFSEGLDLPGAYCRHVIIVKLPFAVPDDPIDQAIAEWAEARGRNAFYEISVPDAALKLVQACGRLIRHEKDFGTITMLDKRIVTQRYGRTLIESLPPFRLDLPSNMP